MNSKRTSIPVVIPPMLDEDESELAARNEFLAEKELFEADGFDEQNADDESDEIILNEGDAAPGGSVEEQEAKNLRRTKRRKSVMFLLVFGAVFGVFVVFISWAFGFGFFAPQRKVAVDRKQKTNNVNSSQTENSGDEKLKTALAIVANDPGNSQNSPVVLEADPNSLSEQDLKLASGDKTGEQSSQNNLPTGNMIVLPDENSGNRPNGVQNQMRVSPANSQRTTNVATPNLLGGEVSSTNSILQPKTNNSYTGNTTEKSDGAIARSVFFGSVPNKNSSVSQNSSLNLSRGSAVSEKGTNVPAFGSLLPVRLLGAIYTLRGSGGLVRMELSRSVKKGGFSYPAGTVIVGRLRGSDYNRAYISVIGAIDAKSGKLIKFEGEVLGVDGASGINGTRKSIKSWGSRFLAGLREAGGQAAGVLTSRGGRGGTIVLGGTGGLSGEVNSIIRGNSSENSFVMVRAGTDAYVLITDLPKEQRGEDLSNTEMLGDSDNKLPGMNLSEEEMAEILTTSDPDKIRAALLKMSPQFRALAIGALEAGLVR